MFNWIRRKPTASRIRPKHRLSLESLEDRQLLSTVPIMGTLVDRTLPSGGPLYVPVISSSGDNSQVSYTATSSDPNVTVIARQGYGYLDIAIAGFGPNGTDGHLIFQMFSDISPNSVATISTLVQQSFYTNLTLHRVVPNFVVQGGDPNGDGTGGPGFSYATETGDLSKFFGAGQLSLANQVQSGNPISNGSQFFVTFGPNPLFNGSFTLLGQMVRGFDVLDAISKIPTNPSNNKPTNPPVITSATIVPNYTDTVLMIVTPEGYNANPTITVTATTSAGSSTQSFRVLAGDGGIDLQRIQFVNRAFSTILGRPADPDALDYYTNLLANNQVTTSQIALEIQTSLEARMKTVDSTYRALLNRAPGAEALAANTIFLMNGGSVSQMQANIVASQEFFEAKGGTNATWITAVFQTATGATSVPLSYSNQVSYQLDTGLKRVDFATTIFDSIASDVFTVQGQFKNFLERTPTTADALPLAQQINSGVSEDLIVATIVGSAEFFNFTKNQNAS
jgi:cyclophilin family peptidyl-prolyl cis-trans isomerase